MSGVPLELFEHQDPVIIPPEFDHPSAVLTAESRVLRPTELSIDPHRSPAANVSKTYTESPLSATYVTRSRTAGELEDWTSFGVVH